MTENENPKSFNINLQKC